MFLQALPLFLNALADEHHFHGAVTDGIKFPAELIDKVNNDDAHSWAKEQIAEWAKHHEKEEQAAAWLDKVLSSHASLMKQPEELHAPDGSALEVDPSSLIPDLTPMCRAEMIQFFEGFVDMQNIMNATSPYFDMIHSTQTGDAQVGLMQRCQDKAHGTYCWAFRPFTMLAQKTAPPLETPYAVQGCCVPTDCAHDPRDASARLMLCNPEAWMLITALNLAEAEGVVPPQYQPYVAPMKTFEATATMCGTSKHPGDFGTTMMYCVIGFLAFLVILASGGQYFHDVYVAPHCRNEGEKFSEQEVANALKMILDSIPPAIQAFSFQKNWKSLMNRVDRPTNFLDGIRSMSYLWVIMGHSYSNSNSGGQWYANLNHIHQKVLTKLWAVTFVTHAPFSVDTFFWLGGFLFSYLSIKKFDRMKSPFKAAGFWWPMIYITRWLRLTPVVMFGLVMAWKVFPTWLGDETPEGISLIIDFDLETCGKYWYLYFFHIVTLRSKWIEAPEYAIACMGHLWYLSTEFTMVWFTPLIFIGYLLNKYFGIFLSFVGLVVGLSSSAYVSADNFHGHPENQMFTYYLRALPRCGAYFIGFGFGLICYTVEKHWKTKEWGKPKMNVFLTSALQVLSCAIMLFWLQYEHTNTTENPWNQWQLHMWTVWSRPGWAFALCILCISLLYGPQKGFIASFLRWNFWGIIGKLSFAGYVLHFPIFYLRILYTPVPENFTPNQRLHLFLGHATISTFASLCTWFLVEAPFATLAKLFVKQITNLVMGGGEKKPARQDEKENFDLRVAGAQEDRMRQKTDEGVPEKPRQKTNDGSGFVPHR